MRKRKNRSYWKEQSVKKERKKERTQDRIK